MRRKSILFLLLVAGIALGLASYKKCRECTATDYGTGYSFSDEACYSGPNANKNLNDWEDSFRTAWSGYSISCSD
jgi:hypothetical protein